MPLVRLPRDPRRGGRPANDPLVGKHVSIRSVDLLDARPHEARAVAPGSHAPAWELPERCEACGEELTLRRLSDDEAEPLQHYVA